MHTILKYPFKKIVQEFVLEKWTTLQYRLVCGFQDSNGLWDDLEHFRIVCVFSNDVLALPPPPPPMHVYGVTFPSSLLVDLVTEPQLIPILGWYFSVVLSCSWFNPLLPTAIGLGNANKHLYPPKLEQSGELVPKCMGGFPTCNKICFTICGSMCFDDLGAENSHLGWDTSHLILQKNKNTDLPGGREPGPGGSQLSLA